MKKVLISVILLLTVFLITGCVVPSKRCVNDDFCSNNEKFLGNCDDCMPDFTISELEANYYDEKVNIFYCVENLNGEYTGELDITYQVYGANSIGTEQTTKNAYFDSNEFESYVRYNIRKGDIDFDASITSERRQVNCWQESKSVGPDSKYSVFITINSNDKVEELNYNNNQRSLTIEGTEFHFPEILIEEDVDGYVYIESLYGTDEEFGVDFEMYLASYEYENYEAIAYVIRTKGVTEAQTLFDGFVEDNDLNISGKYENVYELDDYEKAYVWLSEEDVIVTIGEKEFPDQLLEAYIVRYPTATYTLPEEGP